MSDQMATDHARDYEAQQLMDDATRAIDRLLSLPRAAARLSPAEMSDVLTARLALVKASRHIVAVWD